MKLDLETKRLLRPGQVAKELKELADNIALMRLLEKNEPAYVLVTAEGFVMAQYPSDLETAQGDSIFRMHPEARVRICRVVPVDGGRL